MTSEEYSTTEAGYEAWLYDGHKGTFEDFLEAQVKVSNKQHLIGQINEELEDMTPEELKELLEAIYDRRF